MEGAGMMGIAGSPDYVNEFLKTQAATALVPLRSLSVLVKEPTDNIVFAVSTVKDAHTLVTVDGEPGPAAARLTAAHSITLASQQVAEAEAIAGVVGFTMSRWLGLKAGALQGRPAIVWHRRMGDLAATLARARQALVEAGDLYMCAAATMTACAHTWFAGHDGGMRAHWTRVAGQLLHQARDRLDMAQVALAACHAATAEAMVSADLMMNLL